MSNKRGGQAAPRKSHGQGHVQRSQDEAAQTTKTAQRPPTTANLASSGAASAKSTASAVKPAASQEAKREARMQRQSVERAVAAHRQRIQTMRRLGILAMLLVLVIGGGAAYFINEAAKPGEGVSQQPSPHIADVNSPHEGYSTDPPTSGPHVNKILLWGVSTTPLVKEKAVHNLEDGGVIINYRPDLDKASISRIEDIARSYDTDVLMAPYPGLSNPVVLTAWGRIDRLTSLDEGRIKRFVDAYRGKDHHAQSGS